MLLSIIIPTLNEAENLPRLIPRLCKPEDNRLLEIILVDGGSHDGTCQIAKELGIQHVLSSPHKGRAPQMNLGAQQAKGDILYFVHADTLPPKSFVDDIYQAIQEGYRMGCYRFRFDSNKPLLKFNAWLTRFDRITFRGGDQSLFVCKSLFEELGGFCEKHLIMEEYDFLLKARKEASFKIIQKDILVSARKYDHNSWLRVQIANVLVFNLYFLGVPQRSLVRFYKRLLRN